MIRLSTIYWDPNPEIFRLPYFDWPIFWYGVLFAAGFAIGFPVFVDVLSRFLGGKKEKKRALLIADRLTIYMVVATVAGARLGHFIFYEKPSSYLSNFFEIFRVWEGGLASHGAAVAIVIALILFSYRISSLEPKLHAIHLLDLVCVPTALAAFFIRLGNFINQEILGIASDLPWAVVFVHPADQSPLIPRHPVQMYEAVFYLAVFFLLWRLSYRPAFLFVRGKLIGLFLILVFGFRFLVEFLKLEQSHLLSHSPLTMGQILSLPAIFAGFLLFFSQKDRS